jgi:acyl-CoA synthetase (AMP-forming)/AMP-acid ligase II
MQLCRILSLALIVAASARADEPKPPEGFKALFNGTDLTGWKATGNKSVWGVDKGSIYVEKGGGGFLLTEKEYGDYELRFEYKLSKGANSGVALRTPPKGDPAYVGMEIQLIDDEGWPGKLADYQHTGSIYDVVPSSKTNNKPIGEWNAMTITCKGPKVTIVVNGETVVDANLNDHKEKKSGTHPGILRDKGHLGFQSYNTRVEFRNVFIKE